MTPRSQTRQTASTLNSRLNSRLAIPHRQLHETPFLGATKPAPGHSKAFNVAAISDETPPRWRSTLFTHSLRVCPVQMILAAIDMIAAQRDGCPPS